MNAQFTLPAGITDAEAFTLTRLGHHEDWHGEIAIERRSEREYDLSITGQKAGWTPKGPSDVNWSFSAWLPLAMLHLWWGDSLVGHLVDDMGTGDFSFVRDREPDEIWAMFDACRAFDPYEHDSPNCSLDLCPGYRDEPNYDHPGCWLAMLLFEAGMYVDADYEREAFGDLFDKCDIGFYDAYNEYDDAWLMMNPAHFAGLEK